jgi:hypothetical protein
MGNGCVNLDRKTLWCVTILANLYIQKLSQMHDFFKGIKYKLRVAVFTTIFVETFIVRRIERDIIINVQTSSCKIPVIVIMF